jgi:hypothetical protein
MMSDEMRSVGTRCLVEDSGGYVLELLKNRSPFYEDIGDSTLSEIEKT